MCSLPMLNNNIIVPILTAAESDPVINNLILFHDEPWFLIFLFHNSLYINIYNIYYIYYI